MSLIFFGHSRVEFGGKNSVGTRPQASRGVLLSNIRLVILRRKTPGMGTIMVSLMMSEDVEQVQPT